MLNLNVVFIGVFGVCRLETSPSTQYLCMSANTTERRACNALEPVGTVVVPMCKFNYYAPKPLRFMRCVGDFWDYTPRCAPDCGTVESDAPVSELYLHDDNFFGGRNAAIREFPWHAGVYDSTFRPYKQVCAGSLISTNVILSAAHCFYGVAELRPTSEFAVAVGKQYRPWDDKMDDGQQSELKSIHIPPRYMDSVGHFQDDLAVLVTDHFQLMAHVRPVCISFDHHFEEQQLRPGNTGVVTGWGLSGANEKPSPILQVVSLPYVDISTCIQNTPLEFRGFITSDKICAGTQTSDIGLCKGDSGGGLAFPELTRGVKRYTLRGVVSSAPTSQDACNTEAYTSFTAISKHEYFIKEVFANLYNELRSNLEVFSYWIPQ